MSRLARPLMLVAMLAALNLAAMTAVAHAHTGNDPASTRHRALGRVEFLAADQPSGQADATVQRLLARERSTIPSGPAQAPGPVRPAPHSGQAGWPAPAVAVLALVLALTAGVAVIATRRVNRMRRAGQPA